MGFPRGGPIVPTSRVGYVLGGPTMFFPKKVVQRLDIIRLSPKIGVRQPRWRINHGKGLPQKKQR